MSNTTAPTIGQLVAADYRTAAVFNNYKIDFCCNGNRSVAAACLQQGLDETELNQALATVTQATNAAAQNIDYQAWPLDLLADYVEKKHHRYVNAQLPVLTAYLNKLCKVHGSAHPELFEVKALFDACAVALSAHMKKEEMVLFPFVRNLEQAKNQSASLVATPFGTVQNPISMMMHEHDAEGERLRKISALTNNYTPPADACNTYKVTFALLKEFEADLHLHIHLENNIIFPKSIKLEASLNN